MAVLVQYRCADCRREADHWVTSPVPAQTECPACAGTARRRFGGALLRGGGPPSAPGDTGGGCTPDVPGTCTLVPTAARMLAARARGDDRAVDRESERQTRAITDGSLNPSGSLQTLYSGGPTASL